MSGDKNNSINWRLVASDFAHNTVFSFMVGPLINGMSSAINRSGYWKGVKAIIGSAQGWKFNAELALAVGLIGTTVNVMMGRSTVKREEPAPLTQAPAVAPVANLPVDHTAREEARREQPVDVSISR